MEKIQSLAKNLFLGKVLSEQLFPYPKVSAEEQELIAMLIESIDKFMSEKKADHAHYDQQAGQPAEYIEELRALGLFGLIVPEEAGGIGLTSRGYSRALQQVGRYDASTALTIGAHSSIGMRGLYLFGTDAQKAQYFEKLASGEMIAAFCLTESGAGSDAAAVKTVAKKLENGDWELTGEKIWITNGPIADFFTVFAKTPDTSCGKAQMSAFIVERSFNDVSIGPKEDKMGIRASATSTVSFNKTILPAANLLGAEGKGFKIAMEILNNGRTGLGGGCIGAMKRCQEMATEHALNRKQFDTPIADFELIQAKLSNMAVACFATESVVNYVSSLVDRGVEDYSLEAAISKIFATEAVWYVSDEALQIAGGNGYMKEYAYERIVRDCRINRIFEGTNEILRMYIALSGLKDAGDYLKIVQGAASGFFNDPIKGFGILSDYTAKRVTQLTGVNADELEVEPALEKAAGILVECTNDFSAASQSVLKKYKKKIIGKQLQSTRLANVLIDLVVGLTVLSRVDTMIKDAGSPDKLSSEVAMANIFVNQAKRRIKANLRQLQRNEDKDLKILAKDLMENGYHWDVI